MSPEVGDVRLQMGEDPIPHQQKNCCGRTFKDWTQVTLIVGAVALAPAAWGWNAGEYAVAAVSSAVTLAALAISFFRTRCLVPEKKFDKTVRSLGGKVQEFDAKVQELGERTRALNATTQQIKETAARAHKIVANLGEMFDQEEKDWEAIAQQLGAQTEIIQKVTEHLKTFQETLPRLTQELDEVDRQLQELEEANGILGRNITALDQHEDEVSSENRELEDNVRKGRENVDNLRDQLKELESFEEETRKEAGTLVNTTGRLLQVNQEMKERIPQLNEQWRRFNESVRVLQSVIEKAEKLK